MPPRPESRSRATYDLPVEVDPDVLTTCAHCGHGLTVARRDGDGFYIRGARTVEFRSDGTVVAVHRCKHATVLPGRYRA